MDIRKVFGANVRRYRLAAGLSQEAVAERMGVDRAYISSIERGGQNATLLTIWQAAQALKTMPAELLAPGTAAAESGPLMRSRPKPTGPRTGKRSSRSSGQA
jgi:transcriptional regulator with XRE-family HTH domain